MFWSLSKEEEEKPSGEDAENRLRHHDLIDSFIKNDQQRMPGSGLEIREETSRAETPESVKDLDDEQSKIAGRLVPYGNFSPDLYKTEAI